MWNKAITALLVCSLAACAAPPLRAPAAVVVVEPRPVPRPATPPPVTPPEAPSVVVVPPAAPAPVIAPAAPYSDAVAARFPDPAVSYRTPAFETGRGAYTSNTELQSTLRSLLRDGRDRPGATTVRLLPLGSSQNGVPIEALLFTRVAGATPEAVQAAGRATVLLVGQQHGDEPAGAEALLVIARQLADGPLQPLLDQINVLLLPRANPDGASDNRRATASGIDANRDHLLLRTPEAQAQARLVRDYRPTVVVDAHEYSVAGRYLDKFNAVQRYDALLQYATVANLPPFIAKASEEWFRQPLLARLAAEGLTTQWYYTTSTDLADRKVSMGGVQPDTGRNVNGLKNAVSFLIETRGVGIGRLHLARRVHTHVTAVASLLDSAARRSADLVKLRQFVDNEVAAKACLGEAVVEAAATPSEYSLVMLDPVTGADKPVPVAWDSALELLTVKSRARPCGYWLSADQADAVRRLRALGVVVQRVEDTGVLRGETWRELARDEGLRSDVRGSIADGGAIVRVKVEAVPALLDAPVGSYYVGLDQPLANLVLAALEPDTQNSYLSHRILPGLASAARVMARPELRLSLLP